MVTKKDFHLSVEKDVAGWSLPGRMHHNSAESLQQRNSVCSVQCALCSVHCAVCTVQCAVFSVQFAKSVQQHNSCKI